MDCAPSARRTSEARGGVIFEHGDRARLFVGAVPLKRYLQEARLSWVLRLGELMDELDWSQFEAAYEPGGRPPLHPRRVLALMMYASLLQQSSLRQTETLALRDVGAWWLTGGLTPDHTTIARFVARHEALLTEDFFIQVTSKVAKHLGATASDIAIDGTVKQAAASSVCALRREALDKKRVEAKDEVQFAKNSAAASKPDEMEKAERRVEVALRKEKQLEVANEVLVTRETAHKVAGRPADKAQVSPTEPEAMMQPLKRSNDYGFAYKPVVAAHSSGLIVGQKLSPFSETEPVQMLIEQHQKVLQRAPARVLADSGFSAIYLLAYFVELGVDLLIPSGRNGKPRSGRLGLFGKSEFEYQEETDRVRCPFGAEMTPGSRLRDRHGNTYREFKTSSCKTCPLRDQCTTMKARVFKRYEGDELKDIMADTLSHPAARDAYRRRSAIVEPVFARLNAAGFTRFHRWGFRRASTEFALRCSAHNICLFLGRWRAGFFALAAIRLTDGWWCVVAVAVRFAP